MIIEVKVPVFAESITEGTLLSWHKKKWADAVTATRHWSILKPTKSFWKCLRRNPAY